MCERIVGVAIDVPSSRRSAAGENEINAVGMREFVELSELNLSSFPARGENGGDAIRGAMPTSRRIRGPDGLRRFAIARITTVSRCIEPAPSLSLLRSAFARRIPLGVHFSRRVDHAIDPMPRLRTTEIHCAIGDGFRLSGIHLRRASAFSPRCTPQASRSTRPVPDGIANEPRDVVDVQPLHQLGTVRLGRLDADAQRGRSPWSAAPRRSARAPHAAGATAGREAPPPPCASRA